MSYRIKMTNRPRFAWPARGRAAGSLNAAALALAFACLALTGAGHVVAQGAEQGDDILSGFVPNGDYLINDGGEVLSSGSVYVSQRAAALLLLADEIDGGLLVFARSRRVDRVAKDSLVAKDGGGYDVAAGAKREYLGDITQEGVEIKLPVPGSDLRLGPKPPLVGWREVGDLTSHSPDYLVKMAQFEPDAGAMAELRKQTFEVKVFFGSWCGVCKNFLPNMLKVAELLEGSNVRFQYYGLDNPPDGWKDPEVGAHSIDSLPGAIVYRNGKEAGRFKGGDGFRKPEQSILRALAN